MANDADPSKWAMDPHTGAKHDILRGYVDAWFPILSTSRGRKILFIDGFAGRGRYRDGQPGSPLIVLGRLLNHSFFPRMAERQFMFLFVEGNADNFQSLQREVEAFKAAHAPWPTNVQVELRHAEFRDIADGLVTYMAENSSSLAPTFAFIDPFGFSGLPFNTIAALTRSAGCEILINLMVNHVNRFIEQESVEQHMEELFGTDVDAVLGGFAGLNRIDHLKDVYVRQLKDVAKFKYTQAFAMRNRTGNIGYYLIFATRSITGLEKMKDAMWKVDPSGDFMFSDRLDGLQPMFLPEPDFGALAVQILAEYGLRDVPVTTAREFFLAETIYRRTHFTQLLRAMEKRGEVTAARPGKAGYPDGTVLSFI